MHCFAILAHPEQKALSARLARGSRRKPLRRRGTRPTSVTFTVRSAILENNSATIPCALAKLRIDGAIVASIVAAEAANPMTVLTTLQTCAQHAFRESA